ncbi:MAG: GNAT family N-acetyltransferase [Synergistaceae bacterium]
MIVRNAHKDEIKILADIEASCFPIAEAATYESLVERFEYFPENFFVAEEEGKIIGFINGAVTNKTTIPDEMYAITSLHDNKGSYQTVFGINTLLEFRHRGVGSAMMKKLIDHAKNSGRKGIILTCKEEKIAFYTRLGFKSQGISNSTHGGAVWYDMILTF